MKALIRSKSTSTSIWILMFLLSFFVATQANAHWGRMGHAPYVPVAICSTSGTNIPFPYFVCCQKLHNGHHVWRDTWVPVSCKTVDARAIYDMGCKTHSPVYGTGRPIVADCQFSFSTGKYL